MSEIPQRLRDAGTGMTASVQPLRSRSVARSISPEGLLGVLLNGNGMFCLPQLDETEQLPCDTILETPPGFSQRWSTRVVNAIGRDDLQWNAPAELLADWQSGVAFLEDTVLAALGQSVHGAPVANGVWTVPLRTATLPPATHTNAYVVGLGANVVVDPGTAEPAELDSLCLFLDDWSPQNGAVQAVFLTHHHADHVTGATALSDRLGVPIWAHEDTASRVSFGVDRCLTDGDMLGEWRVVWTPGHAPGHLCLWHPQRHLLLAGDMVASVGTIVIDPPDGNMCDYLKSLRFLRDLQPRILYPAHGEPQLEPGQRLDGYIAHRLWREAQIQQALSAEPASLAVVTERAYGDVPSAIHWLAQRQALAHLNRLAAIGHAQHQEGSWSSLSDD